jgi:transposase
VHVRNVDELRTLLGREDFVYVADSKLCTKENLEHVAGHGGRFVTILPRTRKEDTAFRHQLREGSPAVRWRKIHQVANQRRTEDPPDIFCSTDAGPDITAEGYRVIWIRSSQKAHVDVQAREEQVRKAELELKALAAKVGARKLRTPAAVQARVKKILAEHRVAGLIESTVTVITEVSHRYLHSGRPRPGDPVRAIRTKRPQLHVTRNTAALRAEARTDGVFPLVTNLADRSKREVLEIYKYQPYIEKRFALTKSEYGIAPIFLKKPRRVVALLHVYFMAIMLSALLERQVRAAMRRQGIDKIAILPEGRATATPTTPRILENFADISWHAFNEGDRLISFPVELGATPKLLLELADVPGGLYK